MKTDLEEEFILYFLTLLPSVKQESSINVFEHRSEQAGEETYPVN